MQLINNFEKILVKSKLIIHDRRERGKSNPGRPPDDANVTQNTTMMMTMLITKFL